MKRKMIALITALAVGGSTGVFAVASSTPSSGTSRGISAAEVLTSPAGCPADSAIQTILGKAAASAQPAASSRTAAAQKASGTQSCSGAGCSQKTDCTLNSCTSGSSCAKGNCTASANCGASSAASKATGSTAGASTEVPKSSCPTGSRGGTVIFSNGSGCQYSGSLASLLNSICGKSSRSKPASSSSKPAASQNPSTSKPSQGSSSSKPSQSPSSAPQTPSTGYSAFQNEVVRLVNAERAKNGLAALTVDSTITKTATLKSEDMAKNNYFSHTSPTYGSPFDLMKRYGVSYRAAGENIAMGQTTPAQVMDGWMNSEGHRANILNASFTKIGVGVAQNSSGRYYWTQHFIG